MPQINRRADDSEIMYYNDPEVPFYVQESRLSAFPNREMLCHWHEDIEFILVRQGRMAYHVNDREVPLGAGQAVLVNARQLHHSHGVGEEDCRYLCVVFRPEVLNNNFSLRHKYIDPVTSAPVPYLLLRQDDPICRCLERAAALYGEGKPAFEMRVLGQLNQMWALLYERTQRKASVRELAHTDPDIPVQKRMAEFIYQNFSRKITLSEVAQSGGVCKSKCCQIFRKYLRKTPGEFLMAYRLEAAAHLLRTTGRSITEIAYACGFNSPSYFSESFVRERGCTPRVFRGVRR